MEEDDEDLSPEPDSEEEEEEEEEEETTDDPEYDPGYKVKQRIGGGRGGPSRRAPRATQPAGPPAQPCQLCGRSALGEAPPGTPPCRLCCPATATQEAPAPESRALGEEEEEPSRTGENRPAGRDGDEDEDEGAPTTVRSARTPLTTSGSCMATSCCMPGARFRQGHQRAGKRGKREQGLRKQGWGLGSHPSVSS